MQKLYCYVDESGQDTLGQLFIVSVVVAGKTKDELYKLCEQFEKVSHKGKLKWRKVAYQRRLTYLRSVLSDNHFKGTLRYSVFRHMTDYDLATVTAIVKAIHWEKLTRKYTTLIYIDGLNKTKRAEYSRELRKLGLQTRKVKGIRKEESNALTRLADAVAGFLRDVLDGKNKELLTLFERGKRRRILVEV